MQKWLIGRILLLLAVCCVCGCGAAKSADGGERNAVDFTVVRQDDLPEKVGKLTEDKRQEAYEMSYRYGGALYLMRGYGIQDTGGYSIQVEYVEENEEELHVKTRLVGPKNRSEQTAVVSCPQIVVKVEDRDKKIIFD